MKFRSVFFVFAVLLAFSLVSGLDLEENPDVANVRDGVDALQDFSEEGSVEALGEQWQKFLLKNKFVSSADEFLEKGNMVFVILLNRGYALSVELLFAFILWLFTLFAAKKYAVYFKEDWQQWLVAFVAVTILAHVNFFNFLAAALFKVMFYRVSTLWRFLSFLVIIVVLFLYLYVHKMIAARMKILQEIRKKREAESDQEKLHSIVEGVKETSIS